MKPFVIAIALALMSCSTFAQTSCHEVVVSGKTYRQVEHFWVPVKYLDAAYPCFEGDTSVVEEWNAYMLQVRAYIKENGLFPTMPVYGDYFSNLQRWQMAVDAWFSEKTFYPQPVYTFNAQRDAEMFSLWRDQWLLHFPEQAIEILSNDSMKLLLAQSANADSDDCEFPTPPFGVKVAGADECSGAVSLTVGATCSFSGDYTNASATKSTGMTDAGCYFTTGTVRDIWFTFTMPASGSVTVQTQAGSAPAMSDGSMGYYTGTCGSLVYRGCDDDSGPGFLPQLTISEPAGTTIYLRYWGYNGTSGNTQFCVVDACPGFSTPTGVTATVSPASAAVASNVTFTCTGVSGGSCSGSWEYQFETIAGVIKQAWSTTATYTMNAVARDTGMVVKVRCSSCPTSTVSSAWLVFDYLTPSSNDACVNAIPLTVSSFCSGTGRYPIKDETDDAGVPAPGCAGYSGGDIWFSVTVPASGNLCIDTDTIPNAAANILGGNHLSDLGMAVYSGTCGSLSLLACDDDNSSNGANPKIVLSGLTSGSTVYIRVWDKNKDQEGIFVICATDGPAIDPGQNCVDSYTICNDATVAGNSEGEGVEELTAANRGCFGSSGEHQSTWYAFSPASAGTIGFVLTPANGTDDYDFAIWGPFPAGSSLATICPPTNAPLRCSWYNGVGSSNCYLGDCNNTGMVAGEVETSDDVWGAPIGTYKGCVAPITVAAGDVGKVYIMLIDNWSATSSPYSFDWTLGGGCTLDCSVLPVIAGSLSASCSGGFIRFGWTTYSESINDHFSLYRINASGERELLTMVAGAGNSNDVIDYECMLPAGDAFGGTFLLTQTDFNGTEKELGFMNASCVEENSFSIIRVETEKASGVVELDFSVARAGKYQIDLLSAAGQVLQSDLLVCPLPGVRHHSFREKAMAEGVYVVRLSDAQGQSVSAKVIGF